MPVLPTLMSPLFVKNMDPKLMRESNSSGIIFSKFFRAQKPLLKLM